MDTLGNNIIEISQEMMIMIMLQKMLYQKHNQHI